VNEEELTRDVCSNFLSRTTAYASLPCDRPAEPPPTDQIHSMFPKNYLPLIAFLVTTLMNLTWA
jgi:hypothetical protein